ncbi:iron chelate uptake ABC transporter family permease subunit, partial [Facklamia hominis]
MISLMILGLCLVWGSVSISSHQVYLSLVSLFKEEWSGLNPSNQKIILAVRLPRILNAFLIGAGLSLAGLTMQSLFKN